MWSDRVSNPGPLAFESDALPTQAIRNHTAELQWLEYHWNHENVFETGVVRTSEC